MAERPVVWLATYPKVGNTWLRIVLSELLRPGAGTKEIIPSFGKAFPVEAPLVPVRGREVAIVKTHLAPDHHRMADAAGATAGVVTMRRHPLDILLSSLNYAAFKGRDHLFRNGASKPVEAIVADGEFGWYVDRFAWTDGFPMFHAQTLGLSTFIPRWRERAGPHPFHVVAYEDMTANPVATLRGVVETLGWDHDDAALADALARADRRTAIDGAFIWRRRANNFATLLPPETIAAAFTALAPMIAACGYPAAPPAPAAPAAPAT